MEGEEMLHYSLNKGGIVEVLICWMDGVDQKFFDPDGVAGKDNARWQHVLRQRFHDFIFQLPIEAVGKSFEDEERLLVHINSVGNIG